MLTPGSVGLKMQQTQISMAKVSQSAALRCARQPEPHGCPAAPNTLPAIARTYCSAALVLLVRQELEEEARVSWLATVRAGPILGATGVQTDPLPYPCSWGRNMYTGSNFGLLVTAECQDKRRMTISLNPPPSSPKLGLTHVSRNLSMSENGPAMPVSLNSPKRKVLRRARYSLVNVHHAKVLALIGTVLSTSRVSSYRCGRKKGYETREPLPQQETFFRREGRLSFPLACG